MTEVVNEIAEESNIDDVEKVKKTRSLGTLLICEVKDGHALYPISTPEFSYTKDAEAWLKDHISVNPSAYTDSVFKIIRDVKDITISVKTETTVSFVDPNALGAETDSAA